MFSFVFMQQNGLTITIKGGHDATAFCRCNRIMFGSAGTGVWDHSSDDHYFCFYSLCCCEIYSGAASSTSLKYER